MAPAPLLVVDGDNLAHRAYHSVPKTLRSREGRPINVFVGWTNMVLLIWSQEAPRNLFVAWDTLGSGTYRNDLWPSYQAGRVFDDAIVEQLDQLPALARAFGFGSGKQAGYEADDLMAAAVAAEVAAGGTCLVLTTDRDTYQLVSDRVTVLSPRKGISDIVRIGPAEVQERMGVPPGQVTEFKALAGDSSDNIPGARGVGPKGAAALLAQHGGLEAVLATRPEWAPGTEEGERVRMFYELTAMRVDVPVELPPTREPDWAAAADWLRAAGAITLADRVAARAGRLLL
ncbi:MAG: hypothetical protein HYX52_03990 [Chloroflexi bacterium]|nr:hypothetical protein [Chloroflexota bacterium]